MKYYRKPQTPRELLYQVASLAFTIVAVLNFFDVFGDRFQITPLLLIGLPVIMVGRPGRRRSSIR